MMRENLNRKDEESDAHAAMARMWAFAISAALIVGVVACGDVITTTASPAEPGHDGEESHGGESREADHADDGHAGGEHAEGEEEEIEISPEIQERFGIVVSPARPGPVAVTIDLPGEIRPDPDRIVHVKPRFPGTVTRVQKHVGDTVEAGETLAVIESSQALAPYVVKAAIDGVVIEEHAPIGEAVNTSHSLFTVADTSEVWVVLQVPTSDIRRVTKNDPVEILLPGSSEGKRGTIFFVNPVVDEVTRTASARIVMANEGGLNPGLFVTGRVAVAREDAALSVPTSALVRDGDGWVVFVREGSEHFSEQPVEVGLRGLDHASVVSGLEPGTEVVSKGAFLVKSAAARSEMGGGHSH